MAQDSKPDASRRDLIGQLLGVAGAGAALTLLQGCVGARDDAGDGPLAEAASQLSTSIVVVNNVTELRAKKVTVAGTAAILLGRLSPGDGGGGVFFSEAQTSGDDDGTIFVPPGAGNAGRWRRLYSGVIDVRWFGALPGIGGDQGPAINRALAAAKAAVGGFCPAIHIPNGEYTIQTSVIIPRIPYRGLVIRGDGINSTVLKGVGMAEFVPVVTFSNEDLTVVNLVLEDMTIQRLNKGSCLVYDLPLNMAGFPNPGARLESSVFRNLFIYTADAPDFGQANAVSLRNVHYCSFENVMFAGGESAFYLRDSSFCVINGFRTWANYQQRNGIRLEGGGSHSFHIVRMEGCGTDLLPGQGIVFSASALPNADGTQNTPAGPVSVLIDTLTFEGRATITQINILAGTDLTFLNVTTATASNQAHTGVYNNAHAIVISDGVSHVRFIGGAFTSLNGPSAPSSQTLFIASGASDIYVEGRLVGSDSPDIDLGVAPGAQRVRLDMIEEHGGGRTSLYAKHVGMVGALGVNASAQDAWIQGPRATVAEPWGGGEVQQLPDGTYSIQTLSLNSNGAGAGLPVAAGTYSGQSVLLFGPTNGVATLVSTSGNLRLASPTLTLSGASTVRLIYDGAVFREVSRSVNA